MLFCKTQGILKLSLTYKPPHQSSPLSKDNGVLSSAFTEQTATRTSVAPGDGISRCRIQPSGRWGEKHRCFSLRSGVEMSDFYSGVDWKQLKHGICGPARWRRAAAMTEPIADLRSWISYRIWNFMGASGEAWGRIGIDCAHIDDVQTQPIPDCISCL